MTQANLSASPAYEAMIAVLAKNWWAVGIRGVLGILFGLIALFLPGATMLSLVLVFAAYAFVDGVFAIVSAVRAARERERWGHWLSGLRDTSLQGWGRNSSIRRLRQIDASRMSLESQAAPPIVSIELAGC
jgi:Short repeat of unknown function (DUF308)